MDVAVVVAADVAAFTAVVDVVTALAIIARVEHENLPEKNRELDLVQEDT